MLFEIRSVGTVNFTFMPEILHRSEDHISFKQNVEVFKKKKKKALLGKNSSMRGRESSAAGNVRVHL